VQEGTVAAKAAKAAKVGEPPKTATGMGPIRAASNSTSAKDTFVRSANGGRVVGHHTSVWP
jgi:hypothetical protein